MKRMKKNADLDYAQIHSPHTLMRMCKCMCAKGTWVKLKCDRKQQQQQPQKKRSQTSHLIPSKWKIVRELQADSR